MGRDGHRPPQVGDVHDVQNLGYFGEESIQADVCTILSCTVEGTPEDPA